MPSWLFPAALTGGLSLLTGALAVIWLEIKTIKREAREDMEALKAMEGGPAAPDPRAGLAPGEQSVLKDTW
ncbi:MAG: hypothetical protein OXF67_07350 [Cyanobacteria bacterium MAG CAR4_bin_6]|nr:hypothetical protein [Cyanobacteria bacterium MAG CAR4_bin_6]